MTVQDRAGHCTLWKQLPAAEEARKCLASNREKPYLSKQRVAKSQLSSEVNTEWGTSESKGELPCGCTSYLGRILGSNFLWRKSKRSIFTETGSKARAWDRDSLVSGLDWALGCHPVVGTHSSPHLQTTPHSQEVGKEHVQPFVAGWGSQAGRSRAASAQGSWAAMSVTAPNGTEHPSSEPLCDSHIAPLPLIKGAWQNISINWLREKRRDFLSG